MEYGRVPSVGHDTRITSVRPDNNNIIVILLKCRHDREEYGGSVTHIGVFDKPGGTSSSCREKRIDALVGTGGGDTTVTGWRNIVRNRYAVSGRENHEQTEYSRPTTVVCESHKSETENVRNKKNVHLRDDWATRSTHTVGADTG